MLQALKRCTTCKRWKSLCDFSKWTKGKDGLQPRCKQCAANYYAANRTKIYPKIKERRARVIEEGRRFLWNYLKGHACVDCGEDDPLVLDFDHVRGVKRAAVTELALGGFGIEAIKEEIMKCEVRCANCHRRKTATELGWYKVLLIAELSALRADRARQDGHRTFNPG